MRLSLCTPQLRTGETRAEAARRAEPSPTARDWASVNWSASGAASPFVTRRNLASLSRTREKRTVSGSGSNFLLHGLNLKKKNKNPTPPRCQRAPYQLRCSLALTAQPWLPGGRSPLTSPPSMKLSRPHSGTSLPPGQWKGGSRAGARGARPCSASEAGAVHRSRERACIRGARLEEEAPRLQPGILYTFSRPCTGSFTAARFPKPATLLGSVILQTPTAHILASCLRGVPLSLPKPKEVFNIQRKMHSAARE